MQIAKQRKQSLDKLTANRHKRGLRLHVMHELVLGSRPIQMHQVFEFIIGKMPTLEDKKNDRNGYN